MTAQVILQAIAIGSRKAITFGYKNTRGKRATVTGRIVGMHATGRGLSFKLDNGKTVVIKCARAVVAQVYA